MTAGKEALVAGRLDKRCAHSASALPEYVRHLKANAPELRHLINLLTTNETFFFREEQHFDFIRDAVLPARDRSRPFRLWSAASSTGEEAYTAAMVLSERCRTTGGRSSAPTSPPGWWRARSWASTDHGGREDPAPAAAQVLPARREEYDGSMAVARPLRQRVNFLRHNLMEDLAHLGKFDVIMLRNVMIYFEPETKRQLVGRLQEMLHPGGYLIVGRSESLSAIPSKLVMVEPSIYRIPGQQRG